MSWIHLARFGVKNAKFILTNRKRIKEPLYLASMEFEKEVIRRFEIENSVSPQKKSLLVDVLSTVFVLLGVMCLSFLFYGLWLMLVLSLIFMIVDVLIAIAISKPYSRDVIKLELIRKKLYIENNIIDEPSLILWYQKRNQLFL